MLGPSKTLPHLLSFLSLCKPRVGLLRLVLKGQIIFECVLIFFVGQSYVLQQNKTKQKNKRGKGKTNQSLNNQNTFLTEQ